MMASRGEAIATSAAVDLDRSRIESVGAEDRAGDLGAAGADKAGDAENFAAADLEDTPWSTIALGSVLVRRRDRSSTASATAPVAPDLSRGASSSTSRPTIMRMMSSTVTSATLPRPTDCPSRRTV